MKAQECQNSMKTSLNNVLNVSLTNLNTNSFYVKQGLINDFMAVLQCIINSLYMSQWPISVPHPDPLVPVAVVPVAPYDRSSEITVHVLGDKCGHKSNSCCHVLWVGSPFLHPLTLKCLFPTHSKVPEGPPYL